MANERAQAIQNIVFIEGNHCNSVMLWNCPAVIMIEGMDEASGIMH